MDITSLIITFVGILVMLALYIISRISRSKLPQEKKVRLPTLKNEDGTQFSSVLDDIPARDGSTPKPATEKAPKGAEIQESKDKASNASEQKQHILFISANDEAGLDGNLVSKVLKKNGLVFGDMDIYHYLINIKTETGSEKTSLFRVANGIDPWTLKKEELNNKNIAGLSIVLLTPSKINDAEAIKTFIAVSHKISLEIDGILKNQNQQVFTPKDETSLLESL